MKKKKEKLREKKRINLVLYLKVREKKKNL